MENSKSKLVENLFEYLKENQKTTNQLIRLSTQDEVHQITDYTRQDATENKTISILLDRLSELIELNKLTLQTIDLLDKRVKRLHSAISQGSAQSETIESHGSTEMQE